MDGLTDAGMWPHDGVDTVFVFMRIQLEIVKTEKCVTVTTLSPVTNCCVLNLSKCYTLQQLPFAEKIIKNEKKRGVLTRHYVPLSPA